MIPRIVEKQVIRMTRQGMTEAEIVRQTGLSRNAVRRMMKLGRKSPKTISQKLASIIRYEVTPTTPKGRCPVCNCIVTLPCKCCLTRIYNSLQEHKVEVAPMNEVDALVLMHSLQLTPESEDSDIKLELRPRHRRRYELVRQNRDKKNRKKSSSED